MRARNSIAASVVVALMATAVVARAEPPPAPSGDTLATREMILVNQVGFARGTARWIL